MKDLNRYLTKHCLYWKSIGLNLDLTIESLSLIESNENEKKKECFGSTLQTWLQQDLHATWSKLELAITNAKREQNNLDPLEKSK